MASFWECKQMMMAVLLLRLLPRSTQPSDQDADVAETFHISRLVVVFATLKAFVLSLEEGGEVYERHSRVCRVRVVMYIIRIESSEEL
ncbi:hypothetical protein ABVT39_003837 [Epinephelus coioides]